MKILNEAVEAAYLVGKQVYNGELTRSTAIADLEKRFSLNRNSAADLINNLACMLDGKRYTRTNNNFTTEYYLKMIYLEFGLLPLAKAVSSVGQHLDYYESLRGTNLVQIRDIYNRYNSIVQQSIPASPNHYSLNVIASELNRRAAKHPIGMLQEIRAELK